MSGSQNGARHFGVHRHNIESWSIFFDDAVNPFITAAADCSACIAQHAGISHRHEELDVHVRFTVDGTLIEASEPQPA
jgi:hypothetical protein